jgi:hypothetical protein
MKVRLSISIITLHRFAIAKEMYLQGRMYVNKVSRIHLISAILNYDYAIETIPIAVALDNNVSL